MDIKKDLSIAEAIAVYLGSVEGGEREEINRQLHRFLRWYGSDRKVSQVTPPEIGQFAEYVGKTVQDYNRVFEYLRPFLSYIYKQRLTPVILSSHLRLAKAPLKAKVGSRSENSDRATLTLEGYAKLEQKLKLLQEERPKIAEELQKAAADKDFRENAPLEAARDHQGQVEARIRAIEATLATANVIDNNSNVGKQEVVVLGDTVNIRNMDTGEETGYKIVGHGEADLRLNRISSISPIGKALLGSIAGKEITIVVPAGIQLYKIISIKRD